MDGEPKYRTMLMRCPSVADLAATEYGTFLLTSDKCGVILARISNDFGWFGLFFAFSNWTTNVGSTTILLNLSKDTTFYLMVAWMVRNVLCRCHWSKSRKSNRKQLANLPCHCNSLWRISFIGMLPVFLHPLPSGKRCGKAEYIK